MVRYVICSVILFASFIAAVILFILDMKNLSARCAAVSAQPDGEEQAQGKLLTKTYTRSVIFLCVKLACALVVCIIACAVDGLYSHKELVACLIFIGIFGYIVFSVPIMWHLVMVGKKYSVKFSKYTYLNPSIMGAYIASALCAGLVAVTAYEIWLLII